MRNRVRNLLRALQVTGYLDVNVRNVFRAEQSARVVIEKRGRVISNQHYSAVTQFTAADAAGNFREQFSLLQHQLAQFRVFRQFFIS